MKSKRYKNLPNNTNLEKPNSVNNLIPIIKKNCTTKFDEAIDLSFQINNKQKKNEVNLRTVINMPGGTGKKVKVAVVCEEAKIKEAKESGADIVGGDDLIEKIKGGYLDFEKLIKNFNVILETLEKEKSNNTIKGDLIRSAFITSTMGVSYKIKLGKSI